MVTRSPLDSASLEPIAVLSHSRLAKLDCANKLDGLRRFFGGDNARSSCHHKSGRSSRIRTSSGTLVKPSTFTAAPFHG
ncbi:hypothetical protein HBI56_198240 [Parastagonospora nodorum]|uniref:Uncharacterized protein n=1 Tax=Phaeosphaeria nodorum (strain SN15 / ATCC MYA-4574 / FGSC 10173) TaxID=321614 RepID=Q0U0X7_PHANO|nr:hypothetical protein SNOG_14495 [Parastagonospora nodorum SN15]KAH3906388.1 hypothetical protein HBH56_202950 [Parastagonospora nodorum]EAT78035.1 hypothetical protein SNOG_14495 [Parastagonospora nodorum SN15]KAH3923916.1 hypothetical protein HBH54_201820 [Parastagonospora nodorum]KAH3941496.1 hypothetical protein HBH53_202230 [Parastagonospora nodorum]KAH3959612.1 hypothetical protein HBH51_198280 [Parastagonospora nodorum]